MGWATDRDFPAFDQINCGSPRFDANVAAAAKNRFCLAVNHANGHRALDGNCIALNDADEFLGWFIRKNGMQNECARAKRYYREEPRNHSTFEDYARHLSVSNSR